MAEVSTSYGAIESAKKICSDASKCLTDASGSLEKKYKAAGDGWQDQKYHELGQIVAAAVDAMGTPIDGLNESIKSLAALQQIIEEYEGV